jgi:hypothetical protein
MPPTGQETLLNIGATEQRRLPVMPNRMDFGHNIFANYRTAGFNSSAFGRVGFTAFSRFLAGIS